MKFILIKFHILYMGASVRGACPKLKIFLKNCKICLEFVKSVMVNRSLSKRASRRGGAACGKTDMMASESSSC